MAKIRIPIPEEVAAQVQFESNRTCCVCRIRGKSIQIHHINENPSDNSLENLAVLCLECHNDTQIKGGFGRKLDANLVRKYQAQWLETVKEFRSQVQMDPKDIEEHYNEKKDPEELKAYLNKIADFKIAVFKHAQIKWDSGITANMLTGNYEVVGFYESVLNELTRYYPSTHFGPNSAKTYISQLISSKYEWHNAIARKDDYLSSMDVVMYGGNVIEDVNRLVKDLARHLTDKHRLNYLTWEKVWDKAEK